MYPANKAQVKENSNPAVRCDVFSCISPAKYYIGRPDGPRNLPMNLCEKCYRSLVDSIIIYEGDRLLERKDALELDEMVRREKEEYGGREFVCKHCGEVFYSPRRLGAHVRAEHKGEQAANDK